MNFKIHIFCETNCFYNLIKKTFTKDSYSFNYSEIKGKNSKSIIKEINYTPDCIIVDKDIEEYFKVEIIKKYSDTKIILLPALNEFEQKANPKNVIQISEPFKLSELGEVLKEIYITKQSEASTI